MFSSRKYSQVLISHRIFTGDVVEGAVWLVTGNLLMVFIFRF
jgi:hypothetical protein